MRQLFEACEEVVVGIDLHDRDKHPLGHLIARDECLRLRCIEFVGGNAAVAVDVNVTELVVEQAVVDSVQLFTAGKAVAVCVDVAQTVDDCHTVFIASNDVPGFRRTKLSNRKPVVVICVDVAEVKGIEARKNAANFAQSGKAVAVDVEVNRLHGRSCSCGHHYARQGRKYKALHGVIS